MNPVRNLLLWVGYFLDQHPAWTTALGVLLPTIGGGIIAMGKVQGLVGSLLIGAGATALGATAFWRHQNDDAEDIAAARNKIMDDCLIPLFEQLHRIPSLAQESDRRTAVEFLAHQTASSLREAFLSVTGVRVAVFEVSEDQRRMTCTVSRGRGTKPKPFFKGTPRGDKAFDLLTNPEKLHLFVSDIAEADPGEWEGSGNGYSTFISAPIRTQTHAFGMLTIDAPKAGDLEARDGATVSVFAAALGVAYAEANR